MFTKFMSIDREKRERIVNAALKEFSQKGYSQASTNEIVKEAGISKGLLFHYFHNKKELYLYLYDYSLELLTNEMNERLDWNEKDIFFKVKEITLLKIELARIHPDLFEFLKMAINETAPEVKIELDNRNKELLAQAYAQYFTDIDLSKFKDGLDVQRAINIIIWTIEGFGNQENTKNKFLSLDQVNVDEVMNDFNQYLEMLKSMFYK